MFFSSYPTETKKPHLFFSLLNSLLDTWRFLMSLITFPRPKTPFLLACAPSLDWVRLCWSMVFPFGVSHFNPHSSWTSLSRNSIHHVPSWVPSRMQNGRSTWCVLQSSLLFVHFSVTFAATEDFFCCCCFLLQFVKVKATTWNQTVPEVPGMLCINRNSFLLCFC